MLLSGLQHWAAAGYSAIFSELIKRTARLHHLMAGGQDPVNSVKGGRVHRPYKLSK